MSSSATQQPTPIRVFQMLNAYHQTEALRAALELDLFTQLSDSPMTAADLAKRINAAERGTRILSDFLVIGGLLNKTQNKYSLAPDAQVFLSRRSPAYIGTATQFLCTAFHREQFARLTDAVRRGGAAAGGDSTSPENPMWVDFARGMAPLRIPSAEFIAKLVGADQQKPMRVLD
ncbi:MAG TPA: methyltransferase dimerization domain-containing protein, partial [Terriglobales bacterium]|nr:methyltransferase dimerization domain-containing protein [Terriglobales bacterium]